MEARLESLAKMYETKKTQRTKKRTLNPQKSDNVIFGVAKKVNYFLK